MLDVLVVALKAYEETCLQPGQIATATVDSTGLVEIGIPGLGQVVRGTHDHVVMWMRTAVTATKERQDHEAWLEEGRHQEHARR